MCNECIMQIINCTLNQKLQPPMFLCQSLFGVISPTSCTKKSEREKKDIYYLGSHHLNICYIRLHIMSHSLIDGKLA